MNEGINITEVLDEGVAGNINPPRAANGRKRVAIEVPEEPATRRRSSARDVLPIDDEKHQYFPCPVVNCPAVYQNRSERSYHLRQEHPGYKYKNGDGFEKRRIQESAHSADEEDHILDVETTEIDTKPVMMLEEDNSDFSEEPAEDKYIQHIPGTAGWNASLAVQQFLDSKSGRDIPDGITGGNFSREDEIYRAAIDRGPRRRGRPKNPPGAEPSEHSKVRVSDPNGRYLCYVPECGWRGGYRSIRAEHMKWVHKDWKAPPRYILQRMSRDGVPYKEPEGEFACLVEGCPWRGNYRASRSSHMKSQHPDFVTEKKKADKGGYCPDGKYHCHEQTCDWRGSSRSTRASHMKREHPGYLNPMYQPRMILCPECNTQCCTHKVFVDHMVAEHGVGGSVQREFADIQDYEEWYEAVQDAFCVEFMKKSGVKRGPNYTISYLYCARGYRPKQIKSHPYSSSYMKQNNLNKPYRVRNHCCAFLRVLTWDDGRLTVLGCVDHTGHRMGTSLLRLNPFERDIMEDFLYVNDDTSPLEVMLDKFRAVEDYVVEGYFVNPCTEEMLAGFILDENDDRLSLNKLLQNYPPGSFFDVNTEEPARDDIQPITLGIMTEEMKELWIQHGSGTICFEEVRLMLGNYTVSVIFILAFVDKTPRCCCVYISNVGENRYAVFKKLQEINPLPPHTFICDVWQNWTELLVAIYGDEANNTIQAIGDWHLLTDWANHLDNLVPNRFNRFVTFATLRRWLRAPDQALFDCYVVEMFEAFRELEMEAMTEVIDTHLSDQEFFKKWNPLIRSGLTDHSNPVVEIACRYFRERFLNAENCTRIDQYVGLVLERIPEFNKCEPGEPIARGMVEAPRPIPIYESVDPGRTVLADGNIIEHNQVPEEDRDEEIMLEEIDENDIKYGHHQIIQEYGYQEEVEEEEIVMEMEEIQVDALGIPPNSTVYYKDPMLGDQVILAPDYVNHHPSTSQMMPNTTVIVTDEKKDHMLLTAIDDNPEGLKHHHLEFLEDNSQIVDGLHHSQIHDAV